MNKGYSILFSVLLIAVFLLNRNNSFSIQEDHFSQDLRNRIVGARILKHQTFVSPYFYKWQNTGNDFLLDPYDTPDLQINRNTVTPFTLQIMTLVSDLKYGNLSLHWYIFENIALLLILSIFLYFAETFQDRQYLIFICIGLIGLSQAFSLHNLAGQYYIFFPLLLSGLYFLYRSRHVYTEIIGGILFACIVFIRPNLIVFMLPFIIMLRWRFIYSFLSLVMAYVCLVFIKDQYWIWNDYFKAMNLWYNELFKPDLTRTYMEIYGIRQIEGSSAILRASSLDYLEDTSVVSLVYKIAGIKLSKLQLIGFAMVVIIFILGVLGKKIRFYSMEKLFVLSFLFYFISEMCIPAIRNSYNAVQWVFPLLLMAEHNRKNIYHMIILVVGFLFSAGIMKFIPYDLFISEIIFLSLSLIYLFNYNIKCKKQLS